MLREGIQVKIVCVIERRAKHKEYGLHLSLWIGETVYLMIDMDGSLTD